MKMYIKSVMVEDQAKAHAFYTDILGFRTKDDIPMGEHRWLTLVSPEDVDGVELALEPNGYPAASAMQAALMEDGIPWTSFGVENVQSEFERLEKLGVSFTQTPMESGGVKYATFNDTCGNLIQIVELGD
ncbi:MAG: VOC family protein [Parasphingorhabdus sp.]|uniref:VOC family protein n=1 Tax=Parasphingorhabdus sp. TaxID=2709688 RepID=UPI00326588C9